MRFKIIDTNDFSIVHDSNLDTMAYRTKYTNRFSPNVIITATNVPKTAVATSASFQTLTSGVYMSKINYWRVKKTDGYFWMTSQPFSFSQNIAYSYGSSSNIPVLGDWYFSFQSSNSSNRVKVK